MMISVSGRAISAISEMSERIELRLPRGEEVLGRRRAVEDRREQQEDGDRLPARELGA